MSVPSPESPMIRLSCNLKTLWKSLDKVSICLPNLRSAAIPTQSLPTMPTSVPPLYSKIDIFKSYLNYTKFISKSLIMPLKCVNYIQTLTFINYLVLQLMTESALREKVTLSDNLPKIPAARQIAQLRSIYEDENAKEKIQKYIPIEKQQKYEKNFVLFDRNNDGILDYEELKQFLISIGQMINEEDLRDFYNEFVGQKEMDRSKIKDREKGQDRSDIGINLNDVYLIILKKMREDDVEEQLAEAFKIVSEQKEKDKESGFLESDFLKEMFMTMGYKWGQEQTDEFIKQFEPKSEKRIYPNEVVKKLMKR